MCFRYCFVDRDGGGPDISGVWPKFRYLKFCTITFVHNSILNLVGRSWNNVSIVGSVPFLSLIFRALLLPLIMSPIFFRLSSSRTVVIRISPSLVLRIDLIAAAAGLFVTAFLTFLSTSVYELFCVPTMIAYVSLRLAFVVVAF